MLIKIQGRYYSFKKSVLTRLRGIALLILTYLCYKAEAYEVALIFLLMGAVMVCPQTGILNHFIYWMAKKIVRQGHRREY